MKELEKRMKVIDAVYCSLESTLYILEDMDPGEDYEVQKKVLELQRKIHSAQETVLAIQRNVLKEMKK